MNKVFAFAGLLLVLSGCQQNTKTSQTEEKALSGNPLWEGWYADPEGVVFGDEYWIYPTFSAKYEEQVFLDAFSSKDLVTWTKHEHIIDTTIVKWANRAMWAPSAIEKDGKYFLFFAANDIQNQDGPYWIGLSIWSSTTQPNSKVASALVWPTVPPGLLPTTWAIR